MTTKITNHETYRSTGIPTASSLLPDPLQQFSLWFKDAQDFPCPEPEAFALSTVSTVDSAGPGRAGIPSTRVLLLKEVDDQGFIFFTNYNSRKGKELGLNSDATTILNDGKGAYASMAFYFREQHRSIRVVGHALKLSPERTQAYFASRPLSSRIGAWSSPQSTPLPTGDRETLEALVKATEEKFGVKKDAEGKEIEMEIPAPDFWGGVRIVPFEVECWSGMPSRVHDRFRYTRKDEGAEWEVVRLAP